MEGLLTLVSQGRHRYYGLATPQVAAMLESIMGVASTVGPKRTRPGPKDEAMREARVCYDHLAGDHAVSMFEAFVARDIVRVDGDMVLLGRQGETFFEAVGIDTRNLQGQRRPMCRACLGLERETNASRRHAWRSHPRQDRHRKMGAAGNSQPRGTLHTAGTNGISQDVFVSMIVCAAPATGRATAYSLGNSHSECFDLRGPGDRAVLLSANPASQRRRRTWGASSVMLSPGTVSNSRSVMS
jgi:hypothetical protein